MMRKLSMLLLICLFAFPLQAQETRRLVLADVTEIRFPDGIRFGVDLSIPAGNFDEITLTVVVNDETTIIFDVDPVNNILEEGGGRVRSDWVFTPEQTARWYDGITYEWAFHSPDGRTETFSGEFMLADPRAEWSSFDDPEGDYRVVVPRRIARAGLDFPAIYDQMQQNTGTSPRVNWVFYPAEFKPGCILPPEDGSVTEDTTQICDPEDFAQVMEGWELFQLTAGTPAERMITRELVGRFYADAWAGKRVPDWFKEGLATFYDPASKATLLSSAREVVRTRRGFSMQTMSVVQDTPEWRAQSYGMMAYLVDKAGALGVVRLANLIASATDFATAYQQLTGQNIEVLLPVYERWVFSREAEAAFGVTPYQAPTPTASPTLTPSPTYTFTPSPTSTITPTPTVTGVITRTTAPTITPQPTRTAPPATVTPRPPGSLQTPTPIPVAPSPPSVLEQPTVRVGAFVILAILLVVLVVLLIRSGERR